MLKKTFFRLLMSINKRIDKYFFLAFSKISVSKLKKRISKNDKVVVLLCEKISDRVILLNKLWSEIGFKTILIYCYDNPTFKIFDKYHFILKARGPNEAFSIVNNLQSCLLHYFSYGPDSIGQLLSKSNFKYIYDYKDLFSNVMNIMLSEQQSLVEVAIVRNAYLITHRDNQIYNFINQNNLEIPADRLFYCPEYISSNELYEKELENSLSRQDEETIRIIINGGYQNEYSNESFSHEGIAAVLLAFSRCGFYVDVIGGFSNTDNLEKSIYVATSIRPAIESGHIRVLPGMPSDEFDKILLNYDFAAHLFNFDICMTEPSKMYNDSNHLNYCGSARIYSYMKASLPIILGNSLLYVRNLLDNTAFPIVIDSEDIPNLRERLLFLKKSKIRLRVKFDRIKFSQSVASKKFEVIHQLI